MITILHGENIIASRNVLTEQIQQAKAKGLEIIRLDAKRLERPALETALQATSLFGDDRLVVIEELHSLPKSKKKSELIELVRQADAQVLLWEKRELTKTMLKQLPDAKVSFFKTSSSVFSWLDSLTTSSKQAPKTIQLLHQAIDQDGEELCFFMLIRQIRLLLQAKANGQIAGPPFVVQKIKRQAQPFSLDQLLAIHDKLYTIDKNRKTGQSKLSLVQELDLLHLGM